MKTITFDAIFILLSGVFLLALDYYGLLEKNAKYSLIPLMIAYQIGKYAGRKFPKTDNKKKTE